MFIVRRQEDVEETGIGNKRTEWYAKAIVWQRRRATLCHNGQDTAVAQESAEDMRARAPRAVFLFTCESMVVGDTGCPRALTETRVGEKKGEAENPETGNMTEEELAYLSRSAAALSSLISRLVGIDPARSRSAAARAIYSESREGVRAAVRAPKRKR